MYFRLRTLATRILNIKLLTPGKTANDYLKDGIVDYNKRIIRYINFEMTELIVKSNSTDKNQVLAREAEKILGSLKNTDHLILLDEAGDQLTSIEFSGKIQSLQNKGCSSIVFVIGGAYGFHESVYKRADYKMALSKMTFTHQMVRLIFLEQLYRAFTILRNEKYHH